MLTARVTPPILSYLGKFSSSARGIVYDNLFDYNNGGYTHTKSATVGYDSMSTDIIMPGPETRDWITNGIGRHIIVMAPSGIVWEGFVNEIQVTVGSVTIKIGPLLDIANRVKVDYTTPRYNTNPPIGGDPASTAFATDADSIGRWGTFEEVISGGEGVAATMEAMRDSKLNELAWPKVGQDFSTGGSGQGAISLSCLGYYHYFSRYLFDTNTTLTGTVTLSTRVADILNADPDGLFLSSNANIETNALTIGDYDEGREALTALQEVIGLGFSSGRRALFGVGNNRLVTYKSIEIDQEPKYRYNMYESTYLSRFDGPDVFPWDVEVGEWIVLESLAARPLSPSLPRHSDPRYIFIESVTYTAPDTVSVKGGLGSTLKEKMASQYGLAMRKG